MRQTKKKIIPSNVHFDNRSGIRNSTNQNNGAGQSDPMWGT